MSAYIVDDQVISAILEAVTEAGPFVYWWSGTWYTKTAEQLGQILVDQNYRSVNARYNRSQKPHQYIHRKTRRLKPIEIVSLCDCYSYQACETDDWRNTEAAQIVEKIKQLAIHDIDGYGWGVSL